MLRELVPVWAVFQPVLLRIDQESTLVAFHFQFVKRKFDVL